MSIRRVQICTSHAPVRQALLSPSSHVAGTFDAFVCVAVMLFRRRTHVVVAVAEWIPKSLLRRWTFDVSKTEGPGRRGCEKQREERTENKEGFQTTVEGVRRQAQTVVDDIGSKSNCSGCERYPFRVRLWSKRRDGSDGCRCESFPHVQWTVGRATPLMDALATTTAPGSSFPWLRRIQGRVSDLPRRVLSSYQGDGARRQPLGSRPKSMRPPIT